MLKRFLKVCSYPFLKLLNLTHNVEPLSDPTKFSKREGEADRQARKRQTAEVEAEYNAVTCVSLYMLLMSFSQRGIDVLRAYQNKLKAKDPDGNFTVSEGFDDGMFAFYVKMRTCAEYIFQRLYGSGIILSSATSG